MLFNICLSSTYGKSNPDSLHSLIYKIIGRNFEYDEALKIIQFEEYTEDIDFDEIKRYDVHKRVGNLGNPKSNLRRGRKHSGRSPGNGDNMKNKQKKVIKFN